MNHVEKLNITEFVDLKVFYSNFCPLHFSVRRVSMITSPSKKRPKVRGFDG
jgi:hypothetical protein